MVKVFASGTEDAEFDPHLRHGDVLGRVIPFTSKLVLHGLPCQASGVIGSALGLVGPVLVHCDLVR